MTSYFLSSSTIFFVILDVIMDEVLECKDILSSICIEGLRTMFFLLIKKKETENKRENKSSSFNSLPRYVDFSPSKYTRSDWIKAVRTNFDPLQSRSTWQIILQKRVSISTHKSFSLLFLFCSPFFLCFVLFSTSFYFFLILYFSAFFYFFLLLSFSVFY